MSQLRPLPVELTEAWMPSAQELVVRVDKLRRIQEAVNFGSDVYVFGPKGSGKTLTCRVLLGLYPPSQTLFVPCERSLMRSVASALIRKGVKIDETKSLEQQMAEFSPSLIAVFDNVHEIYHFKRDFCSFLNALYQFNFDRHVRVIVTSTWSLLRFQREVCSPETDSRYGFTPIAFGGYDARQLYMILEQRVKKVFKSFEGGALELIAAKATRLSGGDARVGMRILTHAWLDSENLTHEVAERPGTLRRSDIGGTTCCRGLTPTRVCSSGS